MLDKDGQALKYCGFLALSAFLEVLSLGIKEGLVRSQPINNEKFNFKISLGQFLVGLAITPIIVDIYTSSSSAQNDTENSTWENIGTYLKEGLECVTSFKDSDTDDAPVRGCSFSLFYIIGYTLSTFLFQIVLKALLERRKFKIIRKVFAFTIPITLLAFLVGYFAVPDHYYKGISYIDILAVLLALIGVFVYNWNEEKPTKISIEKY